MRTEAGNKQIYRQKGKKQARDEGLEPRCSLRREPRTVQLVHDDPESLPAN